MLEVCKAKTVHWAGPVLLIGALATPAPALAADGCEASRRERLLPQAGQAIETWERSARVALSDTARESVLRQYCVAAVELNRDQGVEFAEISDAAGAVLPDYLRENVSSPTVRPLRDLLEAQFALNARPITPGPRALGRIRLTFRRQVDLLEVGGRQVPAYPMLISEAGTVAIAGIAANQVVCRGNVTVIPAGEASFTC